MQGKKQVIVVGSSGMLGAAFMRLLSRDHFEVVAPSLEELELTNVGTIRGTIKKLATSPAFIINCAAWTDVDGAEVKEAEATVINADAVLELGRAASDTGATLVHFGTDYVFAGNATKPYRTDEPRAPLNAYGRSKALGEENLEVLSRASSRAKWLNIRTSWLYAPWGKNFVKTIAGLLKTKPSISVVNDQRGRPTSAEHLAATALALADRNCTGHWHVTDGGECSWFDFAKEIGRLTNAPGVVNPCNSDQFPRPAKRPAYSVLDLTNTERTLGQMPSWEQNLASVVRRMND